MKKSLRMAGVILVLGIGAVATYQLAYQSKIGALDKYMVLLGDKLMNMVPEGSGKQALASYYDDFISRVKNREIEPERVERVAAVILNAANTHQTITPQQAESLIKVAAYHPMPDTMEAVYPHPEAAKPAHPQDWESLGERLKSVYEFNEEMLKKTKTFTEKQSQLAENIRFQVENGLKVIVNAREEADISNNTLGQLSAEIQNLEKQKLIIWQKDFKEQMETQMKQMQEQLEQVQSEIENRHQVAKAQERTVIEITRAIKSLDSLQIPLPVDVDSILIKVHKELNEAEEEKK